MVEDNFYDLLKQYPDAVTDRKRLTALVKDFFPGQPMQENLIAAAFDTGIAADIEKTNHISNAFAFRYVKRLVDEYGINRMKADWVVALWCVCYGQKILKKSCDIKIPQAGNNNTPAIKEERSTGIRQYGDLFSYAKLADGYGVTGFDGENKSTIIFSNQRNGMPVLRIMKGAFSECAVREAVLSEGISVIEESAFKGCPELKQAILPQSLRIIEDAAFEGCVSLITAMLPTRLEQIGSRAFAGTPLKSVDFPQTLYHIGEGAYAGCQRLEKVVIPQSVIDISVHLFEGCSSITQVKLPAHVDSIGENAFAGCAALEKIEIPASVQNIGANAFADCHPQFTMLCYRDSAAERHARQNNLTYQIIY